MAKKVKTSVHAGGLNFLAILTSHIPCCGSQLFLGIFGVQALGAVSSSLFYRFQFVMPIIVALLLSIILALTDHRQKKNADFCHVHNHKTDQKRNVAEFFTVNLLVGYAIVFILYVLIPPHDHHLIDAKAQGRIANGAVAVAYLDAERNWPWNRRYFIADASGQKPQPAQEIYWYSILFGKHQDSFDGDNAQVAVRLFAKTPNPAQSENHDSEANHPQFYIDIQP
jgi:hypothetical protein